MSTTPIWKFKRLLKGDMIQDPIQDEFFKTSFTKSISNALVREVIQNSLDAHIDDNNEPVKIRFYLSPRINRNQEPFLDKFFEGLTDHIDATLNGSPNYYDLNTYIQFLVIEDFNTRGLIGDPEKAFPGENDTGENFFYFWRNYGRSGKSDKDRGRWGLGKTVFSAISKINTFFGLTIRNSEKPVLLMGQAVLKTHIYEKFYHSPYGYFGVFRDHPREEYFASPVEDEEYISNFCRIFRLKRVKDTGLSIVIPFPDQEISQQGLITATILQFFYPIMAGGLIVEVVDGSLNDNTLILSRDSILSMIESGEIHNLNDPDASGKENISQLLKFTTWAINLKNDEYVQINEQKDLTKAPKWTDDLFEGINLNELGQKFDDSKPIAFYVPVKVHKKRHQRESSKFKVYLQRDESLTQAQNYFIREGLTITGIISFKERGIRGMVVIDEAPLTTMLGDAENPAHTEWQRDSSKFKDRYEHGAYTLSFVKNSMREIILRLAKPGEGVDQDLLSNIFFINTEDEKGPVTEIDNDSGNDLPADKPEDLPVTPPNIPPGKLHPIRIRSLKDGVSIKNNPEAFSHPDKVRVQFAYRVRKGNPFDKYRKFDFDLSADDVKIDSTNVEIILRSGNLLEFKTIKPDFYVSVTGFDINRDLVVQVNYTNHEESIE